MSRSFLGAFASVVVVAFASLTASGQVAKTSARPAIRVTAKVNAAVVSPLAGTHPLVVEQAQVGARVAPNTAFKHMILVLQPSDDQEYALRTLLDSQQDKTSANYHKWLTPETFGASFGVASADVAAVTSWLQDSGLAVESVSKSNRFIVFSGTSAAVETAFHTEMHTLTVNGETHVSNTVDISVPTALAPVIRGIASLNNFFPKSDIQNPHAAFIPKSDSGSATKPQYTSVSSGNHYIAPGDAAVIFNSTPLLNGGIDGAGQTIAVIGRTDINMSDVQQFRSMFGLPKQDPTFTIVGDDPGITGDDTEAYLDVEWAGGMAPRANVNFITSGSDYFTNSGIAASALYAVENNLADIITLSYGGCETSNGASGTAFWNTVWEIAASQGQSVFVSTGDSDATGCQASSATYGTAYGVNALGSSAYNVAVGGSMFVDFGPSQYWGAGVAAPAPTGYTFTTATGYIPEAAWNEGALSTTYLNATSTGTVTGSGIVGTGGGISIYSARPSWQIGSGISASADSTPSTGSGIATGSPITGVHRLVPDISFIAASGHVATIFCGEGVCSDTSTGYGIGAVGGTSVATPVMASVQALINERNGGRQGNPNFHFYPLAQADYATGSGCRSVNGTAGSPTVTLPGATCNFHDIVAGSNRAKQNSADTVGLGFDAVAGFDSATGLGSVNIANVATNWSTVGFRATTTTFTLSPATGINHGASQLFSTVVSAGSGSGTPTGDVSLIAEIPNVGTEVAFTLASGAASGTINSLPAGTYNVHVHYAGDGTFAASDSPSLAVNIGKETSTVTMALADFYPGFVQQNPTSIPYGYIVDVIATAAGNSGNGFPTGTTTFAVSQGGTPLPGLTENVDAQGVAALIAGAGYTSLLVAPNYPTLAPGAYTVTATYNGDNSFSASTGTSTFTVAKVTSAGTLTSSAANITAFSPVQFTYSVARISSSTFVTLAAYPSGTVVFTDTTTAAVLGSAPLNSVGVATFSTSLISASGANNITATYSGDANYAAPAPSAVTVTVGTLTSSTTNLAVTAGTYYVSSTVPLTATVSPAAAATVRFYDGTTLLGSATSSASTGIAILNTASLTAGSHSLSAAFAGTATYAASTGTTSLTVSQNITSVTLDSPVASVYGQTIALAGRIVRSPTVATPVVGLTGTVTFKDGATTVGSSTPVYQAGYAYYTSTLSTLGLTAGTHTLSAIYSGDANYTSATSSSVTLTVAPLMPALSLTAPSTVYSSSASIPLTATLPISNALAVPTASVTFYNGNTAVGSVTPTYSASVGGYVATQTVSSLGTGSHVLTAVYAGDANYASTSGTLNLLITTNNVWVANGNNSVSALAQNGAALTPAAISGGGTAIAVDASGNIWSLNKNASSVAEFSNSGAVISSGYKGGGIAAPTALVIDGAGIVWIANGDGTLSGVASSGATIGFALNTTAYNIGSSLPTSIVVDGSGNLWLTNSGDNSVTEVLGAATPVTTPTTTAVTNNTLAVKP